MESLRFLLSDLKSNLASCKEDRKLLYGNEPMFSDTYMSGGNESIKTLDFETIMSDAKQRKVFSTIAKFSPVALLFGGANNKEETFRAQINELEKTDAELQTYCTQFFDEVAPIEPNKKNELIRLDGILKTGVFQVGLWKGFICHDFYYGTENDYFPKY